MDICLSPYLCFILLIPVASMSLVILCGFIKTNYMHDVNRKKLAKKILLFPPVSIVALIVLWGVIAVVSSMVGTDFNNIVTKYIPFLIGLSVVMILPCVIVFLALRSK